MKHKQTRTATTGALVFLVAALCLCATAAAQTTREPAQTFQPTAAQNAAAVRLRGALAAAAGESFEVVRDRLAKRSDRHGGGLYWLAHLRARQAGEFYVKYRYRYRDRAHPEAPPDNFVEHKTLVRVGERGCPRQPRYNFVCVGDTVILPVVFEDYTEHAFRLEAQPYTPGDPETEKGLRDAEEAGLYREPVPNPAREFMKYVGRQAHYSPHRAPGYTMTYEATFEAVRPGSFNLAVGAGPVPVVVVAPWTPITILSAKDELHVNAGRFSLNDGSNYLATPVILQVGERLTLQYLTYSRSGFSEGGADEEALEATVKEHAPLIKLLPFYVDPAQGYNEWVVEFLPPQSFRR